MDQHQKKTLKKIAIKPKYIQDVWNYNFQSEFAKIMDLIEEFPYVSMDTEFPGVIITDGDNEYMKISNNVESLKVIQIGFTFSKKDGTLPKYCQSWQFNIQDLKAQGSINFLQDAGIDFDKLKQYGINHFKFAEYLISSGDIFLSLIQQQLGLLLNDEITWITFHGGYDFAYLLKLIINTQMPRTLTFFYQTLNLYFPNIIDIKFIIREIDKFKYSGLSKLGQDLQIDRIGQQHQAGSDSLLTLKIYFKLLELYEPIVLDPKNKNIINGLNQDSDDDFDTYYGSNDYPDNNNYKLNQYDNCSLSFNNMLQSFYQNSNNPYQLYELYSNFSTMMDQ